MNNNSYNYSDNMIDKTYQYSLRKAKRKEVQIQNDKISGYCWASMPNLQITK